MKKCNRPLPQIVNTKAILWKHRHEELRSHSLAISDQRRNHLSHMLIAQLRSQLQWALPDKAPACVLWNSTLPLACRNITGIHSCLPAYSHHQQSSIQIASVIISLTRASYNPNPFSWARDLSWVAKWAIARRKTSQSTTRASSGPRSKAQ